MTSLITRFDIEKLDGNIVKNYGGSKQVGLKQLGSKQVGFKQLGDHEAEVFQVSNDDDAVAQRRLGDKQLEERTNTDCLVKESDKVHLGINVGANIRVTGVPGQELPEGNVAGRKKRRSKEAKLKNLLKYKVKMNDPNITMEEYIRLEEEKARRRENDNEKVNMPPFPSPGPTVSCLDDLDFFKDFENEFPAIVYNDDLMSKSYLLIEPILNLQHIDEFNLKDETSLSECDKEEQNVLYFNDLFSFNVIYPDDSKSNEDNDDDKIDIEHSSEDLSVKPLPDVLNTDDGAYAHGSNKLLETSINTAYPGDLVKENRRILVENLQNWRS
ncbi:hypothetical protein Tco_1091308 [Tanacetum coccineum]|uniref:Uncharacterized protein n=1 Tax=Tanacetum coccineum TaxID=301880 RepID=A0ABQ5I801_9ASTR